MNIVWVAITSKCIGKVLVLPNSNWSQTQLFSRICGKIAHSSHESQDSASIGGDVAAAGAGAGAGAAAGAGAGAGAGAAAGAGAGAGGAL